MRLDRRDETEKTDGTTGERLIDLYTYQCVDGMVRTRCGMHIATEGPRRILGKQPYHVRRDVEWYRCVECYEYYLWKKAQENKYDEHVTDIDR